MDAEPVLAGGDVLRFLDNTARGAAFEHYWNRLEASPTVIDLEALRVCIRLLLQGDISSHEKLGNFIIDRIPEESHDAERLYKIAEISLSNAQLGWHVFDFVIDYLSALQASFEQNVHDVIFRGTSLARDELTSKLVAYLTFIKCSYWLPPDFHHFITPEWPQALVSLLGLEGLDETIHDTLSALLALLDSPVVVARPYGEEAPRWLSYDPDTSRLRLSAPIIHQQLWTRFAQLPAEYFSSSESKPFRTWFQWVCHATASGTEIQGIYDHLYWARLRMGLLTGFGDQRKYCLGILRQTLLLAQRNIETSDMVLEITQRREYERQYEKYSTLFETIVLDRYPNQVLACLPELTTLFGAGSLIASEWTTTLLSAALSSKVQDGLRKMVGAWYIKSVTEEQISIAGHTKFLIEGFLPWATQGSLFTTSLVATQLSTTCAHGEALADIITRFFVTLQVDTERRDLLAHILQYVLNTGGKMFQPSVLFLLQGLLAGLAKQPTELTAHNMELVLQISRLNGLPEVTNDLCIIYCEKFCRIASGIPGYDAFMARVGALKNEEHKLTVSKLTTGGSSPLQQFLHTMKLSHHQTILGDSFANACDHIVQILDENDPSTLQSKELYDVLDALWEEADRQEFHRRVAIKIPLLFFHPACIRSCLQEQSSEGQLTALLTKAMRHLQRLSEGRVYLLSSLTTALRKACFANPQVVEILPFEDILVRFMEFPPSAKKEFLFEVVAAEKLQEYLQHRAYASYYGKREWHAYAAVIDILSRFPEEQLDVAKRVFSRIFEPWRSQKAPVPIISKWKDVLQLQAMLVLADICITEAEADWYLDAFMRTLILEQWPRYRYLLEWTIVRIYYRFPDRAQRILTDLANANLDTASPAQIASYLKLAVLVAPFLNSEDFALQLMILLAPLSASQKVHVRHEAHWSIPIMFDLAEKKNWNAITENPAFQALNAHVRGLDKFNAPPSTIRTLRLDAVADYTIANIFQGPYLVLESPEQQRVSVDDFTALYTEDDTSGVGVPPARLTLGDVERRAIIAPPSRANQDPTTEQTSSDAAAATFFQTKSGFDLSSLLPTPGPPSAATKRPASVILIASLIDNPTNLGGLSRISESFGLEALYIDDVKKTAHKDFKATSVTSEKHFPIHELRIAAIPEFLITAKRRGYEVVGIEQTDRSGMLGEQGGGKGVGTLPKKCVLVLGAEKSGITSEVLSVLDRCVEIKTVGVTRSLNVQTAGGIAVFEWWREWGKQS